MIVKWREGVPIILTESEQLSSTRPDYQMIGKELQFTIYAAQKETYRS